MKAEHWRFDAFELWCWRRLLSSFDCKDIKPVNPKGNQSWIFIRRTDAEAEALILRPPDGKNWLIRKDPDAGKDWRWEEKGTTEGEMVGWHHRLHGLEFEQALGVGDGQGSMACCESMGSQRVGHDWARLNYRLGNIMDASGMSWVEVIVVLISPWCDFWWFENHCSIKTALMKAY